MGIKPLSKSPSLELHIEELVLTGFSARDRVPIGTAIERELSTLIKQQGVEGLRTTLANFDHLDAGKIQLAANAGPQVVGQYLARRIYHQLSPTKIGPTQQRATEAPLKP